MRKTNLLALSVLTAIGGLAMMSTANAAEIIESLDTGYTYMNEIINTLTICNEENDKACITLMDRNLGATEPANNVCPGESTYYCIPSLVEDGVFDSYQSCIDTLYKPAREYLGYDTIQQCFEEEQLAMCGNNIFDYHGYGELYRNIETACNGDYYGYETIDDCYENYEYDNLPLEMVACANNLSGSYGYHYEWGNNYGFPIGCINYTYNTGSYQPYRPNCFDNMTQTTTEKLIWLPQYENNGFNESRFIMPSGQGETYWSDGNIHGNVRGGGNDDFENNRGYDLTGYVATNVLGRRGPCPQGYHIPSVGERLQLINIWAGFDNRIDKYAYYDTLYMSLGLGKLQKDLKIPFGGYRFGSEIHGLLPLAAPLQGYMWTSSSGYYVLYAKNGMGNTFELIGMSIYEGLSVRCFRNTPLVPPKTMDIYVTVDGGDLKIGIGSGNSNLEKDLGSVTISNTAQEKSGSFGENSFWVEDMKGLESGYYTTLSVTDLIGENNSSHVIPASNVSLKPTALTKIGEDSAETGDSQVVFGFNDWTDCTWTGSDSTVTYFNRMNTPMELAGRIGKWGDDLQIKVIIPAHTPMDTYHGTIIYTLYDLSE